jgi:hypothetical protein
MEKMMRSIGKILSIGLVLVAASTSMATEGPPGFNGLIWGTEFSTVENQFVYSRTNPSLGGIKYYIRKNEEMTMGEARLDSIEYGFWQDKFCAVKVYFLGHTNFSLVKDVLFKRFGPGTQPNSDIEVYFWFSFAEALIHIGYDEAREKGILTMVSKEFTKRAEQFIKKEKDKEGARKDFK